MYTHARIHTHTHTYIYIYIYIYSQLSHLGLGGTDEMHLGYQVSNISNYSFMFNFSDLHR